MTSSFLENKGSFDPLVLEIRDFISRIKKHIERDNCQHCRDILEEKGLGAPSQRTPSHNEFATKPVLQDGLHRSSVLNGY